MKLIPAGMTFERALLSGNLGRIESGAYLKWIRTLPCDTCGASPPSDPSHLNNYHRGHGTKMPDWWSIPQCRNCHNEYERHGDVLWAANGTFLARAALYLLRAIIEGKLIWKGAGNGQRKGAARAGRHRA